MYKFVKVKHPFGIDGFQWFFKPENIEQIIEHFKKFCGYEFERGVQDGMLEHHPITPWGCAVDGTLYHKKLLGENKSWLECAIELEDKTLKDRINFFNDGRDIFLSQGLSYMIPNETSDFYKRIEKIIDSEELIYPSKPDISNVRYLRWPGGSHVYAKIGNLDIYDKHGNQKWLTTREAEKAAKWFLKNKI